MELLVAHLVGDYILQNDWLAANKRINTFACLLHVALYVFSVSVFTDWPLGALAITFGCHFVQDRFPVIPWFMKINNQSDFANGPLAPWSRIVVDNTLHLVQLHVVGLWVLWGWL